MTYYVHETEIIRRDARHVARAFSLFFSYVPVCCSKSRLCVWAYDQRVICDVSGPIGCHLSSNSRTKSYLKFSRSLMQSFLYSQLLFFTYIYASIPNRISISCSFIFILFYSVALILTRLVSTTQSDPFPSYPLLLSSASWVPATNPLST